MSQIQHNMRKIREATWQNERIIRFDKAISDHMHEERFTVNADYSSHLGGDGTQGYCWTLDGSIMLTPDHYPTYIKMDIEAAELRGIMGRTSTSSTSTRLSSPYVPITSDHLWSNSSFSPRYSAEYRAYLKRYAEGAFEIIWYFVPPERVK